MSAAPEELTLPTSELREGDIVLTYGMAVLLDQPLRRSKVHPPDDYGGCHVTTGVILNCEEVRACGFVPPSFIRDGHWTIQGNDLASWRVLRMPQPL